MRALFKRSAHYCWWWYALCFCISSSMLRVILAQHTCATPSDSNSSGCLIGSSITSLISRICFSSPPIMSYVESGTFSTFIRLTSGSTWTGRTAKEQDNKWERRKVKTRLGSARGRTAFGYDIVLRMMGLGHKSTHVYMIES